MADAASVMGAVADLIWPLLVLGLVVLAYRKRHAVAPALRELLSTRDVSAELPGGFRVNVGGQPVPAQQAVDDQRDQTEQLRRDVSALAAQVAELAAAQGVRAPGTSEGDTVPDGAPMESVAVLTRRVLWVDDRPANNAYEIAALKDREVEVVLATSTAQALQILGDDTNYDALVTDMSRLEDGANQPTAGLALLRELRARGLDMPAVVYASAAAVRRHGRQAIELGAVGATANPSELLELLAVNYGPRFAPRFERQVRTVIERSPWELVGRSQDEGVDFLARRDGRRLGLEAKTWMGEVPPQRLQEELAQLQKAGADFPIWVVTPSEPQLPPGLALPAGVDIVSLERLQARLANA